MHKKQVLLQYEIRTMKWFLLAGILAAITFCYMLWDMTGFQYLTTYTYQTMWWSVSPLSVAPFFAESLTGCLQKGMLLIIPALLIMSVMQFRDVHRKTEQEYFHSLPFTKRERFIVKAVVAYVILTLTALVATVGGLVVRSRCIGLFQKKAAVTPYYKVILANDTVWHTLCAMGILWLTLLAVYSVMMLAHMLVSKGVLAGLIGAGITAAPAWLCYVFYEIVYGIYKIGNGTGWIKANAYLGVLLGYRYADVSYGDGRWENDIEATEFISYNNFWILAATCIIIAVICFVLAYFTVGKNDMAKDGMIVQKKIARIVLGAGIGICFASGVAMFVSYLMEKELDIMVFAPVFVLSMVAIFILCQKLFARVVR